MENLIKNSGSGDGSGYGSEVLTALSMYMAVNANGGTMETPGLKR